jgi:hypothetical protein
MDSKRFNELAKALASGQSRRGVVKGLAAGFFGGAVGFLGRGRADAAAGPRRPGSICRENANCIEGASCYYDGRRRYCACDFIYQNCLNECFSVNYTVNFGFNQENFCERTCATQAVEISRENRFVSCEREQ